MLSKILSKLVDICKSYARKYKKLINRLDRRTLRFLMKHIRCYCYSVSSGTRSAYYSRGIFVFTASLNAVKSMCANCRLTHISWEIWQDRRSTLIVANSLVTLNIFCDKKLVRQLFDFGLLPKVLSTQWTMIVNNRFRWLHSIRWQQLTTPAVWRRSWSVDYTYGWHQIIQDAVLIFEHNYLRQGSYVSVLFLSAILSVCLLFCEVMIRFSIIILCSR